MSPEDDLPPGMTRRAFGRALAGGLLGAGADGVLRGLTGRGFVPEARAQLPKDLRTPLVERPTAIDSAPHLLADPRTPAARHFVRNHGMVPGRALAQAPGDWRLVVDGAVDQEAHLSLAELRALPPVRRAAVLQSAGYARREFAPAVRGIPWGRGAVGCATWTGARLADVLARAGVAPEATYLLPEGEDLPLGGAEGYRFPLSLAGALAAETLVAYEMNGQPLPADHGFPARLVVPGWVGSAWQKWLRRLTLVVGEPATQATGGSRYRVPTEPVAPGARPPPEAMHLVARLPVQSMVTAPAAGTRLPAGRPVVVTGAAWTGEGAIAAVEVSGDGGATWVAATLEPAGDPQAWRRWEARLGPLPTGARELWSRGRDSAGRVQPLELAWNPRGYLGNAVHRVPVQVLG